MSFQEIQEDCYWFIDPLLPSDKQVMSAMCVECHETHDLGWFWPGKNKGYGDYDLTCCLCNKVIRQRPRKNGENA